MLRIVKILFCINTVGLLNIDVLYHFQQYFSHIEASMQNFMWGEYRSCKQGREAIEDSAWWW